MPEHTIDQVTSKDSVRNASANNEQDALINKVAREMTASQNTLMTFDKAPDNAFNRYGTAAIKGLAHVPEGILNSGKHYVNNPMDAVATVASGAGLAVVLKTVLPETGPAGKIAGAAIGGYFLYHAAAPAIDGFKKAGVATTMADLNAASVQIGNAGGEFIVGSALAIGGYKLGAKAIEPVMATSPMKSFAAARDGMYNNIGAKISDSLGMSAALESRGLIPRAQRPNLPPAGYGIIPPQVLETLAKTNPDAFADTLKATTDMQNFSRGLRPHNQPPVDAAARGARETYDAQQREQLPGKLARAEGDKPTGNAEVDNGHDFTGAIREFYKEQFGRDSIDANGMKYVSTVNYGKNYENAFWNGSQMTYGKPGPQSPFQTFMLLDVAGHEITHGVTEFESGLKYWGQSGALNESLSDVFGNLVKQYRAKETADKADWLVGGGIWKESVKGRALRDMRNPGTAYDDPSIGKDPQPAHMKDLYTGWGDNGGVHINSGIPNKAFANFAIDVGGNAWEAPGQIWWAARKAAGADANFGQFAYHTIEQAKVMGKGDLVPKLEKAWADVGVKPDINAKDPIGNGDNAFPGDGKGPISWLKNMIKKAS